MNFLLKVGGELLAPRNECSAERIHYGTVDVYPVEIYVNPRRPAFRYLKRLIENLKDTGDTDRVNFLYEKEGDELDLDISKLANSEKRFDFLAGSDELRQRRFRYSHGKILKEGKPLDKQQKVSNIFGKTDRLELTYMGSPDFELKHRDDSIALDVWESQKNEKISKEIVEKLKGVYKPEQISGLDVRELSILLAVASSGHPEPSIEYDIIETLKEMDYECQCSFEDGIEGDLEQLCKKDLLKETEQGEYVPPDACRKEQFKNALCEDFYGLDYIAEKDVVSAAVLLSLSDETGKIDNILERVKYYGFETTRIAIACKLNDLAEEGVVKESHGWFEVNPAFLSRYNPDQLCFDFCKQ